MNRWQRWDETFGRAEKFLVAAMLSIMILMAFLQIILRNVFSTGISWGDQLVRYLVLWVGFIGAGLATREGKHITIEVFSRWFSGNAQRYLQALSCLVSALICGLLTFAGWTFVQNEAQMGSTTFLQIPVWIPQVIIPITFALMALRFGFRACATFVMSFNPDHSSQNGSRS
ncbi:MAG: TRAP transporter small permease [Desulfobacteraceae bacterium]|jgi:TRAP-type C4-dicarboxylate transport system permease small subunit